MRRLLVVLAVLLITSAAAVASAQTLGQSRGPDFGRCVPELQCSRQRSINAIHGCSLLITANLINPYKESKIRA